MKEVFYKILLSHRSRCFKYMNENNGDTLNLRANVLLEVFLNLSLILSLKLVKPSHFHLSQIGLRPPLLSGSALNFFSNGTAVLQEVVQYWTKPRALKVKFSNPQPPQAFGKVRW